MKSTKPKQSATTREIEWRTNMPMTIWLANLVPGHIADVPDFPTASITETAAEAAEFERFLDEHFPREKFAPFRRYIDNPFYLPGQPSKPSRLWTYRILIENRREMRAAARINKLIAVMTAERQPPLRICEFCKLVFVARRNNQLYCSESCGSGLRMQRARDKAKEYELNRQRKKAAKEYGEQRKAAARKKTKGR